MEKYSFVIACYNSENTIQPVLQEIDDVMKEKPQIDYEIITVVDYSPDNVFTVLKNLSNINPHLKVIELAKNVGKHAALMAGYSFVDGDVVITLDDDGQCPIDQLWRLLEPLDNNYDMAIAQNGRKKQSLFRNFGSWVNARMEHMFIGKPNNLQISSLFAMKRFVCDEILRYKCPYPYIDGLYLRAVSNICNVPMEDRERISGKSGYTLKKCFSLFMNGFTSFSIRPLRISVLFGIICSLCGFLGAMIVAIQKIRNPDITAGYSSLMCVTLILNGVFMFLLGIVGEYIGRIYISINNAPQFVIRNTINCGKSKTLAEGAKNE